MTDRHESRTRAYRYITEQVKKANLGLSRWLERPMADVNYVSLDDLMRLKEGLSDPPQELVVALKKLLSHVTSETEIDDYLVKPFLSET